MCKEKGAPYADIEEAVIWLSRQKPTGKVIHDEIGVSWEVIAREVYICSRNDVQKYADFLPIAFYTADEGKAVKEALDSWDNVIEKYAESIPEQEGRACEVKEKWDKERPKYERALSFAAKYGVLTRGEVAYIQARTGNTRNLPLDDWEYDPLDVAYDEMAYANKKILLERMKPVLEKLPIEQSQKLAAFYDGYTTLAYIPLVAFIRIMPENAKQKLKGQIDGMTASAKEQLPRVSHHAKALGAFYGIRQGNNEKLRGGRKTVWRNMEERFSSSWYLHALRMAALVLLYPVWALTDADLEMLMEYAVFLNDTQQQEIMKNAREQLTAGQIQTPHTLAEVETFMPGTKGEQEILERLFGLEIASEVYDM